MTVSISIDLSASMDKQEDNLKNVGYSIFKQLYKDLQLDIFWRVKSRKRSFKYNKENIFRLLVFSRLLYPRSKKETCEKRASHKETFTKI